MFSAADKGILGTVGVAIVAVTTGASSYAWKLIHADGSLPSVEPGAVVAELSLADGTVKTRHRETLAWSSGVVKQALREGDRIRTLPGSHATVLYTQGVEVAIDPNSQITVHGPVEAKGETLVAAIDVVDGSIRAKVKDGKGFELRDAAGKSQGQVKASGEAAEVSLKAADDADGALGLKVLKGAKVAIAEREGEETRVFSTGEEHEIGPGLFRPVGTAVAIATGTPVPPLDTLPPLNDVNSEGGNVRFRRPVPPDVVKVYVRGKPAVLHEDGTFEVELYDLPLGNNKVDLVYEYANGRKTRQIQRIRVR
ncbi:MAG TPA: hypothetical protein VMV18_05015 [bacterium]|nr:hypothetical protein [bacterium]